jgi:hypothetical protein
MDNPIFKAGVKLKGRGDEKRDMSRVDALKDDIRDEVRRLRDGGLPESTTRALTPNSGSVQTTLDKEAVRSAGHDPTDPDTVEQHWFEDWDVVVIDLRGGEHGRE